MPDIVLNALLSRYWSIIVREDIPNTPEITIELDTLETEIRKRKQNAL